LKCLRGEEEIFAFDVEDAAAWKRLQESNAAARDLRMPCCGAAVVLRTSPLGTRHFAHARRGPCTSAPETAEHQLAKRTVVEGIRRTAWGVRTEQEGSAPDGERWRADVLAAKGKARIAVEIQWSRQDGEETLRRQDRYEAAGVRGLWLFRQFDLPMFLDVIPAFRLRFDAAAKSFSVSLPSALYDPGRIRPKDKDDPKWWSQTVELSKFAEGAVSGKLRFAPTLGATVPLEIHATPATCRLCGEQTRLVTFMTLAASKDFPGHPNIPISLRTLDGVLGGPEFVERWLPASLLAKNGIGPLRVRKSGLDIENRESYLSNGCVGCGAMQARWFEDRLSGEDEELVLSVDVVLDGAIAVQLPNFGSHINHWWFDEREPEAGGPPSGKRG
jgi:competence protein CoiA